MRLLQHSDTDTESSDGSSPLNFNDPKTFASWLLYIGQGSDLPSQTDSASIPLPPKLCVNSIEDLISFIYHGIESIPPPSPEYFLNRTILAPRNNDVADANKYILNLMSGETSSFLSADEIINEAGADAPFDAYNPLIPIEVLCSLNSSSLPPSELHLKIEALIILLHNIDPTNGMCNGTCLIIFRMSTYVLEAQIIGGDHNGKVVFIPHIWLTASDYHAQVSFQYSHRQFPVCLAFAMSINKAQSQSVKYVGLDLQIQSLLMVNSMLHVQELSQANT